LHALDHSRARRRAPKQVYWAVTCSVAWYRRGVPVFIRFHPPGKTRWNARNLGADRLELASRVRVSWTAQFFLGPKHFGLSPGSCASDSDNHTRCRRERLYRPCHTCLTCLTNHQPPTTNHQPPPANRWLQPSPSPSRHKRVKSAPATLHLLGAGCAGLQQYLSRVLPMRV